VHPRAAAALIPIAQRGPAHGRSRFGRSDQLDLSQRAQRTDDPNRADVVRPRWWHRRWGLLVAISPPLASGGPRLIKRADAPGGPQAFACSTLGEHVTAERLAEATAGMERSRDRLKGIESRAQFYLQASGLTSMLVFATIGVLAGDKAAMHGSAQDVALVAVGVAAAALLIAGVHALAGQLIAAVLTAQRRYSQVATWKLRRLKRATIAFLVGVVAVSIAGSAVLAGAL
jgi:hypothetical protein